MNVSGIDQKSKKQPNTLIVIHQNEINSAPENELQIAPKQYRIQKKKKKHPLKMGIFGWFDTYLVLFVLITQIFQSLRSLVSC